MAELDKTFKLVSKEVLIANISDIFDRMEYRLQFFNTTQKAHAFNIGRALGLKKLGHSFAKVLVDGDCESCLKQDQVVDLEIISFDSLPPVHPNCTCKINISDFTASKEDCILKLKRQLRLDNPSWSDTRIKSTAIATCSSS
jgi:hypothetical protein